MEHRFPLMVVFYSFFWTSAQAEPAVILDYNVATLPLNIIPKTSSIGLGAGFRTPWNVYATLDVELNRWQQDEHEDTRYAKDGVSYARKFAFTTLMLGGRYFFGANAKGGYVWGGLSRHELEATIAKKESEERTSLSTAGVGPFFGGGYSFFESSNFDITLGGRLIVASYSGDDKSDWPKFEEQPDTHLITDCLNTLVPKGDITVGWRF